MTESVTSTDSTTNYEESAKALLTRLTIEARYRSPNGGYVSTFNKRPAKQEPEIVARPELDYSTFMT
ncbi:MAG TPA: hypothetical protein V6C89_01625 [Drouetiella sp.]